MPIIHKQTQNNKAIYLSMYHSLCISIYLSISVCKYQSQLVHIYLSIDVGANGVMVLVGGNGHGDASSNPGRDWLHFT